MCRTEEKRLVGCSRHFHHRPKLVGVAVPAELGVARIVMDIWQYAWHRYLHMNRFLYRHIHSWHHRLVVPYPYGTFYSHPAESLVLDTVGGLLAVVVAPPCSSSPLTP
jgi:sterol desaturase/sphingolipid hydroxylase (fatty acid hydroxylase superfamily)